MFKKILIANRGEIARRIARTCRQMGIAVATVHSEADRHAPHVRDIGESEPLGAAPARDSYLSIERVVAAARAVGDTRAALTWSTSATHARAAPGGLPNST